ncbi:MAG TPA: TolC family protein [Polyangia bacterium]|nr:TolC family protein [Polyangia bacterium]
MRPHILGGAALAALLVTSVAPAHAASRTLTIDEAVALALQSNPRLASARARLEAADDSATSVGRRMLPSVHLSEEFQRWNGPFAIAFAIPGAPMAAAFVAREQTTNSFVASADQPVMGLFRTNDERESLSEQTAAGRAQLEAAEADLRATVETQFLRVFEAQALEQIAAASVHDLSEQVTVAKARLASGVITNADLLRIQVAVANAQQQGLEAHSQGQTARAQLFAAIGIAPHDSLEMALVEPVDRLKAARAAGAPGTLASLLPLAAQRRPELTQQNHLILAADRDRGARTFAMLPDVDLEGAYMRLYGQPFQPASSWFVGVKASWAIWEWGATDLARRAAVAQAEAARRDRDTLERQIESELTSSLVQGEAARGAVGSAETAVASAEEAYRVTDASVKAGASTTTDLLQAQAELTQARLNLTRAQYELALSDVTLTRAVGNK